MLDNQSWLLDETVSILATTRVTTYIIAQNKHFHAFLEFSVMSVHRN